MEFCSAETRFDKPRSFTKGFNLVCMNVLSLCDESRFEKPRNFLRGRTSCHFLHRAKSNQKACSDVQKVAGGKFLCVGDRRKDAAGGGGRI